jgi:hypothetical protein
MTILLGRATAAMVPTTTALTAAMIAVTISSGMKQTMAVRHRRSAGRPRPGSPAARGRGGLHASPGERPVEGGATTTEQLVWMLAPRVA